MDEDWSITKITRRRKTKAWKQLGTSGGGNHFVEFGLLSIPKEIPNTLGTIPSGEYVALLSHSGSRGAGADVAKHFMNLAAQQAACRGEVNADPRTAWLDMDSDDGQAYWHAMNLMGKYAKQTTMSFTD